jgi:hypothetical protein
MTKTCTRCAKTIDDDAKEMVDWQSSGRHGGNAICGDCVTTAEIHAIADDHIAFTKHSKTPATAAGAHGRCCAQLNLGPECTTEG